AGEIPYTVITEARGLLSPLVRATILYGHRDRARLAAGHRALFIRCLIVFARVVVQYGLPGARSDIQPPVRAAKPAESIAEPGGKKLRVAREPAVGDVAPGNIGAAAAVDFFLLANFLVDARLREFLCPGGFQPKPLHDDDDHNGQAAYRSIPSVRRQFD